MSQFSGAKVLKINNADPWDAVEANAKITGSYQAYGTRQTACVLMLVMHTGLLTLATSFFSSYTVGSTGFIYNMGNFAAMSLPLTDSVSLTVQRNGSNHFDTITVSDWAFFSFPSLIYP